MLSFNNKIYLRILAGILLLAVTLPLSAREINVRGTVTNLDDEPLCRVSIYNAATNKLVGVTNEDGKIRDYLLNELHHGVTIFNVKGGYTSRKDEVILCVVPTNEYYRVKEGIHEIDKDAFFVVCDAYEVFGGE